MGEYNKFSLNWADIIIINNLFFVDLTITFTKQCKANSRQQVLNKKIYKNFFSRKVHLQKLQLKY